MIVPPPKTLARIAGLLYVLSGLCVLVPELLRSSIIVPGDAAATADNLRASAVPFRLAFVTEAVAAVPWLLTLTALYLLLRHVNQPVAVVMVLFAAVGTASGTLNLLNEYTALTIATGDASVGAFGAAAADELAALFADMHANGFRLNVVFTGPWLVPLGYLIIKSGYAPKIIGVLLMIGCLSYFVMFLVNFLAPDAPTGIRTIFTAIAGIGEFSLMGWLLVKGVRTPAGEAPVPAVLSHSR